MSVVPVGLSMNFCVIMVSTDYMCERINGPDTYIFQGMTVLVTLLHPFHDDMYYTECRNIPNIPFPLGNLFFLPKYD